MLQQFCTHRLLTENDLRIFPIIPHACNKNAILHLRTEFLQCRNALYRLHTDGKFAKYFLKKTLAI